MVTVLSFCGAPRLPDAAGYLEAFLTRMLLVYSQVSLFHILYVQFGRCCFCIKVKHEFGSGTMRVDVAFTQFNDGVCLARWRFNKQSPSLQLQEATSFEIMSLFSLSLT